MKKLLFSRLPIIISIMSLLIVSIFLRYNLSIRSQQIAKEFKSQNMHEIYSIDTLKISSRLNSYSASINWVCIVAEAGGKAFFKMQKGNCRTGLFSQKSTIFIQEANNVKIEFTIQMEKEIERLYLLFLVFQIALIISLILSTRMSENEKIKSEIELIEFARQTYHDIRSPLDVIGSIINEPNGTKNKDELINKSVRRINEIANTLLAKTNPKKVLINQIHTSASTVINSSIKDIINEKCTIHSNVCLIFKNAEKLISADIDQSNFKRMMSNFLNNSIEAKASEISIYLLEETNLFKIIIQDNGTGFPESFLENSKDQIVSNKKQGNGLGIRHALNFAKENEFEINFENTEIGARVTIIFDSSRIKKADIQNAKIHLIDDDDLTRINWQMRAKNKGVELYTYEKSEDFFKNNELNFELDYIYVDCELKNESGVELAEKLNELGFKNIYLCTGHPPEKFSNLIFLKGVIGKSPPF